MADCAAVRCADDGGTSAAPGKKPIRVMVVDDSVVFRGLATRWIEQEEGLALAGSAANGQEAIECLAQCAPDIVLLDINMPEMTGLEALPHLLAARPALKVLMVSALTRRMAYVSFEALARGALDCLAKPDAEDRLALSQSFRLELMAKVKALGRLPARRPALPSGKRDKGRLEAEILATEVCEESTAPRLPFPKVRPRIIVIGSSTGGPQALIRLLGPLHQALMHVPVLITQHMPAVFTNILAERLALATGLVAKEAEDGEALVPGRLYLAPGDRHMIVREASQPFLSVNDDPPLHFHRPSVDLLFSSAASVFGPATLGVVLSGMGADGTDGARAIAAAGGRVLAQDAASSVIWGMPGSVAGAGLACAVLSPDGLASLTEQLLQGERP